MSLQFSGNGEEQLRSMTGLIKFNQGLFKSEKQASFLLKRVFHKVADVEEFAMNFGVVTARGDYVMTIDAVMRWADYGSRSLIPVTWIFVADESGVKAQYKLKFKGNLRDGASPDPLNTKTVWVRPADLVIPEKQVAPVAQNTDAPVSNWVGVVGKRTTFKGKVVRVNRFETNSRFHYYDSGVRYQTVVDVDGNKVIYWNLLEQAAVGDIVEFAASVKAHDVYKDVKQTVVSRASKIVVTSAVQTEAVA